MISSLPIVEEVQAIEKTFASVNVELVIALRIEKPNNENFYFVAFEIS